MTVRDVTADRYTDHTHTHTHTHAHTHTHTHANTHTHTHTRTHTHTHTHTRTHSHNTHTHTHRLDSVLDNPLLTQIELGNYEYTSQHIRTGEHSGNHFRIALRNVRSVQGNSKNVRNVVPLAMEGVKKAGFVNYFGPQRFGGELSAARIGLAMVQGKHVSSR